MSDKKQVTVKENKKANGKAKKPNFFVRMFRGIKRSCSNMWAELKKVSWPKFSTTLKQTGVVLGVVLLFLVVITAFDFGLQKLLTLLVG
ncbi:MAG: preprotein translocase subunit SecE [Christensenellaceae bacterium]